MKPNHLEKAGISRRKGPGRLGCLALLLLAILPGKLDSQQQEESRAEEVVSAVRGQVREFETGMPLAGAAVSLASGPGGTLGIGTRVTDSEGRFLFRRVPAGTYRLVVTFIGYRDLRDTLEVHPEMDLSLVLPMSISPIPMEPIVVEAERRIMGPMGDFERRRRTLSGTFFDREEIEERNPMVFTDLLRMVPGARVVPSGPYDHAVLLRGGCRPILVLDGMRLMTPEGINHILPTMDLEAVEVYHANYVPVEYGANPCGAIVAWTRRGEPGVGGGSFWRRLAYAAGFLTLALLLSH